MALKVCEDKIIVCGIPFSMGIIYEDIKNKIDEKNCSYIESIDKIFVENKDVPEKFRVKMLNKAEVKSILLPTYNLDDIGVRITQVKDNSQIISENVMMETAIPNQKYYLNEIIDVKYGDTSFLKNISTYRIAQGVCSTDEIINELENVSKRKVKVE